MVVVLREQAVIAAISNAYKTLYIFYMMKVPNFSICTITGCLKTKILSVTVMSGIIHQNKLEQILKQHGIQVGSDDTGRLIK